MAKTLLQHTKVIDPEGPYHNQLVDILLSGNVIAAIGPAGTLPGDGCDNVIDASDTMFSPGWVDTGTQLQDPGFEWKESQSALAQAALAGGFTTLIPYPSTIPIPENGETIKGLIARFQSLPVHVFPMGTATEHRGGKEMSGLYDMHLAGAKAYSDGPTSLTHGGTIMRILRYLQSFDGLLVTGAITQGWAEEGHMHEGPVSSSMGMPGIPEIAEKISVQRDINLLAYVESGNIHFSPLSSAKAIEEVAQAKSSGMNVTVGIPIYLLSYVDEDLQDFDENLKTLPPLRSQENRNHLIQLIQNGSIDILSTGHKAEGIEEKLVEFSQAEPGMLALQTAYAQVVDALLKEEHIQPEVWISMISLAPRKRFGLPAAHIAAEANEWTWFDMTSNWTLSNKDLPSRAKNSPLIGKELRGKVRAVGVKDGAYFFD